MQLSVRSTLAAGCAATVVAAGAIAVTPQSVVGAPRSLTASVALAATTAGFNPVGHLFDATSLVSYTPVDPQDSESVSHALGLIPQLLADVMNPPILKAVLGQQLGAIAAVAPQLIADLAAFGSYTSAAAAVVVKVIAGAIRDTVTPSQWGAGTVLQDWAGVGAAVDAMTIGIGARVNGVWVPSLRVAAISTRNQIANDIALGATAPAIAASAHLRAPQASQVFLETTSPNYAADYTPTAGVTLEVVSPLDCYCDYVVPESTPVSLYAAKPAAAQAVRSRVNATPNSAAATPKIAAARTRSAK